MTADDRAPRPLTASQRLALTLGRTPPEPLTGEELDALEAAQDWADAAAERAGPGIQEAGPGNVGGLSAVAWMVAVLPPAAVPWRPGWR